MCHGNAEAQGEGPERTVEMPVTDCECSLCFTQDAIEALMRAPDVMKSLRDILRKVKDASRLLARLMVSSISKTMKG